MALPKNPKVDLKLHYKKTMEISFILSIALVIVAFRAFPAFKNGDAILDVPQELFTIENIEKTEQKAAPPTPPQPPIPIEAPSDVDIPDVEIASSELDPNAAVTKEPTKPPTISTKVEEEPPFVPFAEALPTPVGGMEEIYKHLEYPQIAIRAGVQGTVHIYAYVDRYGNVQKTELIKGIGAGCDEEAMKAVKALKFNPGMQGGKPVNVKLAMSIKFIIKG